MSSPCQNCPHRKLTCHDRCDEYQAYHNALVEAKKALRKASDAMDLLITSYLDRKDRWRRV